MSKDITYKILLEDGAETVTTKDILCHIPKIKTMIEQIDNDVNNTNKFVIDLGMINATIFSYIIVLIRYIIADDSKQKEFINGFVTNMSVEHLLDFIAATNTLQLNDLSNTATDRFKNVLKGNISDVRKTFNINSEFTKDEEEAILKENKWIELK